MRAPPGCASSPETPPRAITLCQSGGGALVDTAQGVGIVWPMGDDRTARFLTGSVLHKTPNGLTLRLRDYAAPRISLSLTPEESALWSDRIGAQHD